MPRLTPGEARGIATRWQIPLDKDFHALRSEEVERVIAAADERRYRKPSNANGSRARYFHAQLARVAARDSEPELPDACENCGNTLNDGTDTCDQCGGAFVEQLAT